jgi:bifunctional UDP-N-acetylglucosamine pyrophosphorylase/glucosamine-1-phosphate N-acetyltransferase
VSKKEHGAEPRLAVVIMAAANGTGLKSRHPKVLHQVGGKALLKHVIATARRIVDPASIFVIVGDESERVRAAVADTGVQFVNQAEQRGTGHAIQCARDAIADYENILVLAGDVPLLRAETIDRVWRFHQAEGAAMTILTAEPENPFGYGRIVRRSPNAADVEGIVEQVALAPKQESLREINSGICAFRTAPLMALVDRLAPTYPKSELSLTDMAGLLRTEGERVVAVQADDAVEVLGAKTIAELVALDATLRAATASRLMATGVTIFRPDTCVIDADVEVAPDTVIEPYVQLLGQTRIGTESRIRSYSVIENCTVGDGVVVLPGCIMTDSSVGNGARIGPYSHLRPGSEIGEEAHVGNFVETKKARLGKSAKANHLAYIGDAEIGARSNIGAGVITCNYDGVHKHKTRIGEDAFVGSDSTLVAPIVIGDGAYIGAGSCITKEVPAQSLAVGRARQVTKEGWAAARREKRKAEE